MSVTTRARVKPNSSFASNRLTRKDTIPGGHLLTSFRTGETSKPGSARHEPATDDEPQSSSHSENDDQSDDDLGRSSRYTRRSGLTLDEKLARDSLEGGKTPRASRQRTETKKSKSSASNRKRTLSGMVDDGNSISDEDDLLWSSQFRSSDSVKRRKPTVSYGSRKSFGQGSTPHWTSPAASQSPSVGAREGKARKGSKRARSTSRSPKEELKMPRAIESSPKPEFKAPPPLPSNITPSTSFAGSSARDIISLNLDDSDSSSSTALSSASSTLLEELARFDESLLGSEDEWNTLEPSLCPWCKESVPRELLRRFQAQPKQRMREQRRFCESHKHTAVEREWREKGYPTINWEAFEQRIEPHLESLDRILEPESSSFYRNILDTKLKSGEAKNFRLDMHGEGLEDISCGYYGTRGATKMLERIMVRYARKLRRLGSEDQIVNTAGVAGYAQAVLVPELAMRLVKEDMKVDDDQARQILRDSMELGEAMNPELSDKIAVKEADEPGVQEGMTV
ncbi:RTC4 family protein [Aspergillus saccharolyticus JOP 1030-1]|uniref:Restriction of telomere capping protein 4 n=1 Tax=Aspergillus saccharolyticus JOP 1030-1 TaxID=1450539 RepID=A0A318ZF75_9EURO|nr:hypothetical protein BP01DRAFT_425060 [Aspergillus saccharolyticus JOP 1030-1]PYH43293.1 hypothetical protein BP01DRAFT_425060 [Aspergillus saccharolyticus JOP 1030-1]